MKMTSRFALVAAAATLFGAYSANAADLGGGCCADLEERVAELEATTARKGNRVVSLQVYGKVNKAILIWDDGINDDINIVDNNESGSDIGFTGTASIKPGWTAGFRTEFNVRSSELANLDQDGPKDHSIRTDHSYLWIEGEQVGRLTIGDTDSATDGIDDIILANTLQGRGTNNPAFEVQTGLGPIGTIGNRVNSFTGGNEDLVRYDSPSIYGFIVSASWSDLNNSQDEQYDLTLRYSGEFNAFRVAAGVGYKVVEFDAGGDQEALAGSVSVMHVPTGLFAAIGLGEQENLVNDDDKDFWHVTAGVEKNYFGYGNTTVYGEYGEYANFSGDLVNIDHDAEVLGFGIVQKIDSAAMDIYAQYRLYSFENEFDVPEEDFSTILIGSRIQF